MSVVLNNGRVLVVGSAGFRVGEEIYNPATNVWSLTGFMTDYGRTGHRMAKLPDGRVVVIGGSRCCLNGVTYSTKVTEIYNPATNSWTTVAPTSIGHSSFGFSVLPDGRMVVSGGMSQPEHSSVNPIDTVEIYDPVANTWTTAAHLLTARYYPQQVTLNDGRVLIMGGNIAAGSLTQTTEFYNSVANIWVAGPPMKRARRDFTASLLPDGRVLVIGGTARNPDNFMNVGGGDTAEIFDPATNSWTLVAQTMSVVRREHAATLMYDGKVLVTGGNTGSGAPHQTAELFDPADGTWTLSTMITQRIFHTGVLTLDGRVLVAGGMDLNPLYTKKAELYGDPVLVARAGAAQTLSGCAGCFTQVTLDGSLSSAAAGSTFVWSEGNTTLASSSSSSATVLLGVGSHLVTLTITQPDGQTDSDTVVITVVDAIAAKDALIQQLQGQLAQAQSDLGAANATIVQKNAQITTLNGQISTLNGEVATLTSERDTLQTQLATANQHISELEDQAATLTTANQQLTSANGQLQSDLATANAQVTTLTGEKGALQSQLNAANDTIAGLNTQINTLNGQVTSLTGQVSLLNDQVASLTGQVNTLTSENVALTAANQSLQSQVSSLTTANQQLSSLNDQLSAQLAIANQSTATCQADLSSLNQSLSSAIGSLTNGFRASFNNPLFVIPGGSSVGQVQSVFNVILGLPNGQQRGIYRGLGGN